MGVVLAAVLAGLAISAATAAAEGPSSSSSPAASGPAGAASRPARLSREDLQKYLELEQRVAGLFTQKKYDEAESVCRQLIQMAPNQPDGYYNLACAQARLGKAEQAIAALKRATEVGFSEADHMKEDPDLASLGSDDRFAILVKAAEDNAEKGGNFPYDKGQEMAGVKTVEGVAKGGLRYRLRMDPNAAQDRPERLIVWLHPSGGYGNNVAEALTPMFIRHGFALLVFTQKNTAGWSGDDSQRAMRTAKEVGKIAGLDAKGPILMGYSAGGQAALHEWSAKPGELGGLILDAAAPFDEEEYYVRGRVVALVPPNDPAAKSVPIFVAVGEQDGSSKLWRQVHADWLKAGVPLAVHYVPGSGHQWLFGKAALAADLEKWIAEVSAGKLPGNQPATAPASAPA
jgi:predicted esterase